MQFWRWSLAALFVLGLTRPSVSAPGAQLTLSPTAITFPSADPDAVASIPATQNPLSVRVRTTGNPSYGWILSVRANGDLTSATGGSIPIGNVTWTATGASFVNGTLSSTNWRTLAYGTGNVDITGFQSYFLANSWNYATGSYTQSVVYTLVAL